MMDERQIPHSIELEQAVLGCFIQYADGYSMVADMVQEDSFFSYQHTNVYKAIKSLYSQNRSVNILTVPDEMKKYCTETKDELADLCIKLNSKAAFSFKIEEYVEVLEGYAVKRRILNLCTQVLSSCYNEEVGPIQLVSELQKGIDHSGGVSEMVSIDAKNRMERTREMFKAALNNEGVSGLPTGIKKLDDFTGGFHNGNLIVVGARPGNGKTALALAASHKISALGATSHFFQQEMSIEETGMREIAMYSGVRMSQIRAGAVTTEEINRVVEVSEKVSAMKVLVDHSVPISVPKIRARVKKSKPQLIVVDYLQLMDMEGKGNDIDEAKLAKTTRALKLLAKEMNVPVILLSQLNRKVEDRNDKKPVMSDLKGSGAIEADADVIILLYNPDKYGIAAEDEQGNKMNGQVELNFVKNRMGATGPIWLKWDQSINVFSDPDERTNFEFPERLSEGKPFTAFNERTPEF